MVIASFPATYHDRWGEEQVSLRRDGPGFRMTVRDVEFASSYDLCDFEAERGSAIPEGACFVFNHAGELRAYTLSLQMPMPVVTGGIEHEGGLAFHLEYGVGALAAGLLELTLTFASETCTVRVDSDWTESGLDKLRSLLPEGTYPKCCYTCAFSDYHPVGGPLACFRGNKTAYLRMERGKRAIIEMWATATEEVHETHLCSEFEHRAPGTGWRG